MRREARISGPLPPEVQRAGMRSAITAQCCGTLGQLAFSRGLILVFLTALGVRSAWIVAALSLPELGNTLVRIPFAHYADRVGKKRLGLIGLGVEIAGFILLIVSASAPAYRVPLAMAGIFLAAFGPPMNGASWFALLSDVVPENVRGWFFGTLRFSWQLVGIVFYVLTALLLEGGGIRGYRTVFVLITIGLAARVYFYCRIPEVRQPAAPQPRLIASMATIIRSQGYASFCAYVFLLGMFTAKCVMLFALVEKEIIAFDDSRVVWLGNISMIGAALGFFFGGRAIDRHGTKPVFLACHFSFGLVTALFVARSFLPFPLFATCAAAHLLFGIVASASSVAVSTELLALIPPVQKSLSTSICTSLSVGGAALWGFLVASMLESGMLSANWTLFGAPMSRYDSLLLASAVMVIVLVVTLGLVPSVIGKHTWIPRNPD